MSGAVYSWNSRWRLVPERPRWTEKSRETASAAGAHNLAIAERQDSARSHPLRFPHVHSGLQIYGQNPATQFPPKPGNPGGEEAVIY